MRTIKDGLEGSLPRERVREVVRAVHVVPAQGGGWTVKKTGIARIARTFDSKHEALAFARQKAALSTSTLIVHNKDGRIVERHSHGENPKRSPG